MRLVSLRIYLLSKMLSALHILWSMVLWALAKFSLSLKAISIVGDEVFSFAMSLTPNATEGAAYVDTSTSDGRVKLNVGCIQVVYLHRFFMSLLVSD